MCESRESVKARVCVCVSYAFLHFGVGNVR